MIELKIGVEYEIEDDRDEGDAELVDSIVLDEVRNMLAKVSARVRERGIGVNIREYDESS